MIRNSKPIIFLFIGCTLLALFNLITSIFFNPQEFVIKTKQCWATDDGLELFAESLRAGKFEKLAKENREKYLSMSPFPHIAFEGAIPPSLIASLQEETDETKILDDQCYQNAKSCFLEKGYQYLKSTINDETMMGYHTRMTYSIMRSQLSHINIQFYKHKKSPNRCHTLLYYNHITTNEFYFKSSTRGTGLLLQVMGSWHYCYID